MIFYRSRIVILNNLLTAATPHAQAAVAPIVSVSAVAVVQVIARDHYQDIFKKIEL